ncbi:hypothetical protein HX859_02645 [Pseudomonas gingeri]|uniref:hypothetical protein n=1 Tax=Pseudomonas gingeri TaxID=117681 RepID=UPI0015A17B35|nr:hypothetical protein [Pseudomonas gingeri]NVZ73773.1 hypothetical protein [Pseudomonas gingeri]
MTMTTNQTINGVRRELLQRIASTCMFTMPEDCSKELRALLDAGARPEGCCCPTKGYSDLWAGAMCPIHFGLMAIKLDAQPQGEPVGFRYRANGGPWEWMDESPFADGRTNYKLGGEELQPLFTAPSAPVAVADLTARLAAQIALLKDLHGPLLEAGLEYDDKFEALAEEVAEQIKIEDIAAGEKVERESQPAPAIHIPRGPGEYDGLDNGVD